MKSLFTQEKTGCLKIERQDLEEYLQRVHPDHQMHVELPLLADILPVGGEKKCKCCVLCVVCCARGAWASGSNGVSYCAYKMPISTYQSF